MPKIEYDYMKRAKNYLGTREVKGSKHSEVILDWLKRLKSWVTDDETPWCGTFVATCVPDDVRSLPKNWLSARAWLKYGTLTTPQYGAVLVFWRGNPNGAFGHVGFYIAEDKTHYHVLGGNQSDSVSVTRIPKKRLLGARQPVTIEFPAQPQIVLSNSVIPTTNGNES